MFSADVGDSILCFCVPPELPQQHVCKEDQQLCNQEEPEPPHMKEEEEKLCSSQEGEQLVLKQETDGAMMTPVNEENEHSEDQTLDLNPDETPQESVVNMPVITSVGSETNSDLQLLSNGSHVAENQSPEGGKQGDSGSTTDAETQQNNRQYRSKHPSDNRHKSTMLKTHCNTDTSKKSYRCETCGNEYKSKSRLQIHLRTHTGEKPYTCKVCGKRFNQTSALKERIHELKNSHRRETMCLQSVWKNVQN